MPNCPYCGAEVKENFKFCLGCGAQLKDEATQTPPPVASQQMYAPMQPKKSNTKLIVGIVVAVVTIVVVLLVVFLFLGGGLGGGSSSDLVGTWELTSMTVDGESIGGSPGSYITFQSGGTYSASGDTGTWEIRDNKIYISSGSGSGDYDDIGFSYQFSNNNNVLTLSYAETDDYGEYHTMSMTLTKSSSESSDESDGGSDGDDEGSGSGSDVSLIGSWEYDMGYEDMTMIYEFVSDGTFNFGSGSEAYYAGTWSTNGDQLCFVYTGVETETCYTYSISGDGNQLTMTYMGVSMVLTKIYVI